MKTRLFILLGFLLVSQFCLSQVISLSPATRTPSGLTFATPTGAGIGLTNIVNTQQSVNYTGTSDYWASVFVALSSGTIPTWLQLTVSVPAGSWFQELLGGYGISQGTVIIDSYNNAILNSIWRASASSRVLTLSVNILDFSQIQAGTYNYQLKYTIGQ